MQHVVAASGVTLTALEVKSVQFKLEPYNQHDLHIDYTPVDTTHAAVQLEVRIYISNDSMSTTLANSTWKAVGTYDDLLGDGTITFTKRMVRARALAANSDDLHQVFEFGAAAKKMYISYLESGSPTGFGTATISLSSTIA